MNRRGGVQAPSGGPHHWGHRGGNELTTENTEHTEGREAPGLCRVAMRAAMMEFHHLGGTAPQGEGSANEFAPGWRAAAKSDGHPPDALCAD